METTSNLAKKQRGGNNNPSGKGGFQTRPEQINRLGTWNPANTVSHQFKRMINMTQDEFTLFAKTPSSEMTIAQRLAYNRVKAADKSLADFKEVLDRTEGKAMQPIEMKAEIHTIDQALE